MASKEKKIFNGDYLLKESSKYMAKIDDLKDEIDKNFKWYKYGILNNFIHLKNTFNKFHLDELTKVESKILDIGAADGDLSFFLEEQGFDVDIMDHSKTNANSLKGAKILKKHLKSKVSIYDVDLDSQFSLPKKKYDLIFFLGILYHLKNPYYALEKLSYASKFLLISTKIAKFTPDDTKIQNNPLAYLVDSNELNNDPTNFWIFSESGFKRLLARTGWVELEFFKVGDTRNSSTSDMSRDERAFALIKSKNFK